MGTYCFDLPSRPASAIVPLDNADAAVADRNLVASVALDRGEDLGDCPATRNDARVRIVDGNTEAATTPASSSGSSSRQHTLRGASMSMRRAVLAAAASLLLLVPLIAYPGGGQEGPVGEQAGDRGSAS